MIETPSLPNDGEPTPSIPAAVTTLIAERLTELGVLRTDRVVVSAPNTVRTVAALFAVMRLGCSLALVDHRQTAATRRALACSAAASWLLCDDSAILSASAKDDAGVRTVRLEHLMADPNCGLHNAGEAVRLDAPPVDDPNGWFDRADALMLWTSGTTGTPKSIVRSGPSIRRNIARTQRRMRYRETDVMLPLLPLSHQYGLSMLLLWQLAVGKLVVCPPHRVDYALRAVRQWSVTVVDAAPSSYEALLRRIESRGITREELSSVRMWCVGGAPLGSSLRSRFRRVVGGQLLDGYGSSELGNIALATKARPTACGPALDDVEITVVDEHGNTLPAGRVGELIVRSPDAMTGVLGPNGEVLSVDRSVYRTEDIGSVDAQGNVTVLGRSRAVHRMGHTLYPEQLAALAETRGCPVSIVDVEDALLGVQVVFVVADPAGRTTGYWRKRYAEVLAEYERPNKVIVVDRLPTNPNGKVDVAAVRAIVEQKSGDRAPRRPNATLDWFGDERLPVLAAVADVIKRRRAEIHDILLGFAHHNAVDLEIDQVLATLDGAADEILTHRPRQVPVSSVFMPSNMLLYGYVLYLVVPSLYVERTWFRPSRKIVKATAALHDLISAEVEPSWEPHDSTQREFVQGSVRQSELVLMTGAYQNAERVRQALTPDQLLLFYGQGVNPFIVGPDADLEAAVADVVRVRIYNSGQDCFGPDQILVHAAVADDFLELLCLATGRLRFGNNRDPQSDYGPLYYEDAFEASIEYLRKQADNIISGAEISITERRLQPTVLDLPLDSAGVAPEMFAPIFNVVRYPSTAELHRALSSAYFNERAMGAMVYGSMPETTRLLRRRHTVCQDSTLLDHDNGNEPFGGSGIRSNYIAYRGKRTAEPILASKAVAEYLGRRS